MRFFTREWWSGDGNPKVVTAYRRHFSSIRHRLPAELVALHERYSLHDGHVRSFSASDAHRKLRVVIDTWDNANVYRCLALEYGRVTSLHLSGADKSDIADPPSWGDLGYHEVDIADGQLEHRMLFAGDLELHVRFGSFDLVVGVGPGIHDSNTSRSG